MIHIKTPLRVSLFGGGTDVPEYFKSSGGIVSGFTINKYVNIFASKIEIDQGFKFRLSYRKNEDVKNYDEIKHPIFREVLRLHAFNNSYHFSTLSTLPEGAGLGSSSSFTVGLNFLMNKLNSKKESKLALAKKAIYIEREVLQEKGGWQDQLHAAYGGFNTFTFKTDGSVIHETVDFKDNQMMNYLNDSLYILYSGKLRRAKEVENSKFKKINFNKLDQIKEIAFEGQNLFRKERFTLEELGILLNEGWELKKSLSGSVSNDHIDEIYKIIIKNGAYGAKLCGAGGGGFFLAIANDKIINKIKTKLPESTITKINIDFEGIVSREI